MPTVRAQKERRQTHKKALHYPVNCVGIKAGSSHGADAVRLYGKGYFVADEDHLGGRYYVDIHHTITLHIGVGTDQIIDDVELQREVHLPAKAPAGALAQAATSRLASDGSALNEPTLGASVQSILERYGKPKSDTHNGTKRVLKYVTDYTVTRNVLYYEAEFRFQSDHLVYISLHNGE